MYCIIFRYSKAFASEYPGNPEENTPRFYMHSNKCNRSDNVYNKKTSWWSFSLLLKNYAFSWALREIRAVEFQLTTEELWAHRRKNHNNKTYITIIN